MQLRQITIPLSMAIVLAVGCAKPPSEQIDAAEKALKEAQQSGAATYSAEEYAKLEGMKWILRKNHECLAKSEKATLELMYKHSPLLKEAHKTGLVGVGTSGVAATSK